MDWSEFVGRIAVGRVRSGIIKKGQQVHLIGVDGQPKVCQDVGCQRV